MISSSLHDVCLSGAPGCRRDLEEPATARTVKVGAEGISGPSWQEPTSVEVGADLEGRGGRDMPAAFMTGLVLAVIPRTGSPFGPERSVHEDAPAIERLAAFLGRSA